MSDTFYLDIGQGVIASSGNWYKNVQFLGAGGSAVTFCVISTNGPTDGGLFALKVFRRISKPERRENFLSEINFLRSCDHPSIMRVYDEGEFASGDDAYPFVIVEYLPSTLAQIQYSTLSLTEKLSFTLQLLSALAYLERLETPIVHRDIKPPNIFLKGRSCVLGDFGLLKVLDQTDEEDREFFKQSEGPGMPIRYRTPDLVAYAKNESNLTVKSDVFQLGLVIAELFTGKQLCKGCNDHLDQVELNELPYIKGTIGGSIASLIRRMLADDPKNRPFASALLDSWRKNFMEAVQASHVLNGEVFAPISKY